ncbi:MAG: Rne/Rng family ribonuclease [Candidatus Omnitrophota bacterium]
MHKEILINVESQEIRVAILENNMLEEFFVERPTEKPMAGNIYKGKVVSVVAGIQAAFVDVGLLKNGFLYVSDIMGPAAELEELFAEDAEPNSFRKDTNVPIQTLVKKDQEIMVQIIKEPFSTKGARLSTHITLPGRYIVYMPSEKHIGISRKIDQPDERARLRAIVKEILGRTHAGIIIRTAGEKKSKREIYRDYKYLARTYHRIKIRAQRHKTPAVLHEEHELILRIIRDYLSDDVSRITIDDKVQYRKALKFLSIVSPHMRSKLCFYSGDTPLFENRGIEKEINKIYETKVHLKSGGCIVIEQTESLVAVDVNTGSYTGKKSHEETVYRTNLEAARELARQVRLRDLGGIIVVDFIDMELEKNRKSVLAALNEAMRRDKAKYNILGLSEIGLLEMTRQRIRKGIESVVYQDCPYCTGRGKISSVLSVSIKVSKLLEKHLKDARVRQAELRVHPDVAGRLFGQDRGMIKEMERRFRVKITIIPDEDLHLEDIKLS